jgi:hypothetical protein
VDQTNALHRVLDKQNTRYRKIFGAPHVMGHWMLIYLFAEAVFSGAFKARFVVADSFSEKIDLSIRIALFHCAALHCHRLMLAYVDRNFVNHPEISAVIVEHLIKTRVPMEHHCKLKYEVEMCRMTVKAFMKKN